MSINSILRFGLGAIGALGSVASVFYIYKWTSGPSVCMGSGCKLYAALLCFIPLFGSLSLMNKSHTYSIQSPLDRILDAEKGIFLLSALAYLFVKHPVHSLVGSIVCFLIMFALVAIDRFEKRQTKPETTQEKYSRLLEREVEYDPINGRMKLAEWEIEKLTTPIVSRGTFLCIGVLTSFLLIRLLSATVGLFHG